MNLTDEQLVQVAACIAAGHASSHDDGAIDAFCKALVELRERNGKQIDQEEEHMKINL